MGCVSQAYTPEQGRGEFPVRHWLEPAFESETLVWTYGERSNIKYLPWQYQMQFFLFVLSSRRMLARTSEKMDFAPSKFVHKHMKDQWSEGHVQNFSFLVSSLSASSFANLCWQPTGVEEIRLVAPGLRRESSNYQWKGDYVSHDTVGWVVSRCEERVHVTWFSLHQKTGMWRYGLGTHTSRWRNAAQEKRGYVA